MNSQNYNLKELDAVGEWWACQRMLGLAGDNTGGVGQWWETKEMTLCSMEIESMFECSVVEGYPK